MNENNKIDVSLEEVTVNLSSIAPRKTVVHVEERDGKYAVITDDNTLLGVFNSTIYGIESEFDAEIRSVRHPTHDHPVGHVVIRLRRKLQESRHPNGMCSTEGYSINYRDNILMQTCTIAFTPNRRAGARQLLCEGLQQEEQLELLSQKQLEMLGTWGDRHEKEVLLPSIRPQI